MMHTETDQRPYAQRQRFRFIESVLLWEGAVQRRRVSDQFGIAANHVTKDLKAYQEEHPDSIVFKPSVRAYVPGPQFMPSYASGDPGEYLALLHAHALSGSPAPLASLGGDSVAAEVLPEPNNTIDRDVLQAVVKALRQETAVEVSYHSTTGSKPTRRTLWPHALVHSGVRWHARAFDSFRSEYRNFALQRMDRVSERDVSLPSDADSDHAWHNEVVLEVIPNPDLNEHQQKIVARDFGMRKHKGVFRWRVPLRSCLVSYFLRRYNLIDPAHAEPRRNRIVLRNHNEIRKLLAD